MISALMGISTDPVIRNSRMKVASAISRKRVGQPVDDLVLEIDQERRGSGDVGAERGPVGAQRGDQVLGGGALGGAGRDHVDRGHVAAQPVLEADRGHPGLAGQLGGISGQARVAGRDAGHDRDRAGAQAGEAGRQGGGDLPAFAAGGQGPGVAEAVVGVQERQRGGQQQRGHPAGGQPRAGLHPAGQPAEEPVVGDRPPGGLELGAPHREQRGDQRQRGGQRDQHGGDPADGHRGERRVAEREQAGQRRGHGQRGEGDGPPGRARRCARPRR